MRGSSTIDVDGETVGIVVPEGPAMRFVAVKFSVWPLDGTTHGSREDAAVAARAVVRRTNAEVAR